MIQFKKIPLGTSVILLLLFLATTNGFLQEEEHEVRSRRKSEKNVRFVTDRRLENVQDLPIRKSNTDRQINDKDRITERLYDRRSFRTGPLQYEAVETRNVDNILTRDVRVNSGDVNNNRRIVTRSIFNNYRYNRDNEEASRRLTRNNDNYRRVTSNKSYMTVDSRRNLDRKQINMERRIIDENQHIAPERLDYLGVENRFRQRTFIIRERRDTEQNRNSNYRQDEQLTRRSNIISNRRIEPNKRSVESGINVQNRIQPERRQSLDSNRRNIRDIRLSDRSDNLESSITSDRRNFQNTRKLEIHDIRRRSVLLDRRNIQDIRKSERNNIQRRSVESDPQNFRMIRETERNDLQRRSVELNRRNTQDTRGAERYGFQKRSIDLDRRNFQSIIASARRPINLYRRNVRDLTPLAQNHVETRSINSNGRNEQERNISTRRTIERGIDNRRSIFDAELRQRVTTISQRQRNGHLLRHSIEASRYFERADRGNTIENRRHRDFVRNNIFTNSRMRTPFEKRETDGNPISARRLNRSEVPIENHTRNIHRQTNRDSSRIVRDNIRSKDNRENRITGTKHDFVTRSHRVSVTRQETIDTNRYDSLTGDSRSYFEKVLTERDSRKASRNNVPIDLVSTRNADFIERKPDFTMWASTVKILLAAFLLGQIFINSSKQNRFRLYNVMTMATSIKEKIQ